MTLEVESFRFLCPTCAKHFSYNELKNRLGPSPLAQLLDSNEVPTKTQIASVTAVVLDRQTTQMDIDRHLNLINESLKLLEEFRKVVEVKRAEVVEDIERHRAILRPPRRLPDEVLKMILLACVRDSNDAVFCNDSLADGYTPHILTLVCRRWRSAALSMPLLWSNVGVQIDCHILSDVRRCSTLQTRLETQLRRSSVQPLTVSIQISCDIPELHMILRRLVPTSLRWKELRVSLQLSSLHTISGIANYLPSLETIQIDVCGIVETSSLGIDMFTLAPKLRRMAGRPSILRNSPVVLPWSQIRVLILEDPLPSCPDHTLEVLRCVPNLEHCHLASCDESGFSPQTTVELPRLRSLFISHCHYTVSSFLLMSLSLPALERLGIHRIEKSTDTALLCDMPDSLNLFDQLCSLALKSTPSLIVLSLISSDILLRFIEQLAEQPSLVPALRSIVLLELPPLNLPHMMKLARQRPHLRIKNIPKPLLATPT